MGLTSQSTGVGVLESELKIERTTPDDKVIAVGKAVLSTRMIKSFKKGVAVKIRDSLKSTNSGV